jgi:hypothetical protein
VYFPNAVPTRLFYQEIALKQCFVEFCMIGKSLHFQSYEAQSKMRIICQNFPFTQAIGMRVVSLTFVLGGVCSHKCLDHQLLLLINIQGRILLASRVHRGSRTKAILIIKYSNHSILLFSFDSHFAAHMEEKLKSSQQDN